MKPFLTVAIPHKDILEGRLTMDVFAADLWQVFKAEAPDEYKNPELFFRKTYLTKEMKNILDIVKKRVDGEGGDPVIQLQTPFGGGKTHSLIALYHKAKEWNTNVVVIDGTVFDPKEITLWAEIERQLTGTVDLLKGQTAPGREKFKNLLEKYQPLVILMDEILQYTTKSAGVKVGDSNLAAQTLSFMQELAGTIAILPKSVLVLTLPSSLLEHYDENTERLFEQLQKITGRIEKIYTPVQDEEVSQIIRKRLFTEINQEEAKNIIEEFLDYAEKEKIIPEGMEKANYRERFIKSYPFQPEVIDVLYKRWGSFPTFQRTRGVLRILALVVYSLKESKIPFIRLGDFDLKNEEIKRELIKHIGPEYDSIIYADITSSDSGAKKVDKNLGSSNLPFCYGTKAATTIFMYSFSGAKQERGATINEIKLSCAEPFAPSSIVSDAVSKLKENLFYISDGGLFFTNQPNLNRILLTKMEDIQDLRAEEKKLIEILLKDTKQKDKEKYFDIYVWPNNSKDIPDTTSLKLVILRDQEKLKEFLENCGEKPRVYRNTIIFLCPLESERINFEVFLKKKLAWYLIEKDNSLRLSDEQKKEVKEKIKNTEIEAKEKIRNLYCLVFIPSKNGFKEIDLGIPTYGIDVTIDREIYEKLRSEGEIFEKLSPLAIKEKYLKSKDYVEINSILESFYKTPGEIRIKAESVFKDTIKEGVKQGLFGIGYIENNEPICTHFKEELFNEILERKIIIKPDLCSPKTITKPLQQKENIENKEKEKIEKEIQKEKIQLEEKDKIKNELRKDKDESQNKNFSKGECYNGIKIRLRIPTGKFSDVIGVVNYIKSKFKQVDIILELLAKDGEITSSEYQDKIEEALHQARITIEEFTLGNVINEN